MTRKIKSKIAREKRSCIGYYRIKPSVLRLIKRDVSQSGKSASLIVEQIMLKHYLSIGA